MLEEPLINGIIRRGRALRMADAVSSEPFLAWAVGAGLGFDPRYPDAHCLGLLPPRDSARFWVLPAAPRAWPHFAGSILKSLDRWETGYLWPRSGLWPQQVIRRKMAFLSCGRREKFPSGKCRVLTTTTSSFMDSR